MNAIWLSDLERQIRNAKHGVVNTLPRPHTSCGESQTRPKTSSRMNAVPLKREKPRLSKEEARQRELANAACFKSWKSLKERQFREAKARAEQLELSQHQNRAAKKTDPVLISAHFENWVKTKARAKQLKQLQLRTEHEAYEAKTSALELEREAAVKAQRRRIHTRSLAETRKVSSKHPESGLHSPSSRKSETFRTKSRTNHVSRHAEIVSSLPWAKNTARVSRLLESARVKSTEAGRESVNADDLPRARARHEARIKHMSTSFRADTLLQLRSWKTPTPEIYVLASIIYKLIHLELDTQVEIVDPYRWLSWKIIRSCFQDDLVRTLDRMDLGHISRTSLVLLYLHISMPQFKQSVIKKRSEVGAVLRSWINNVAGVHDIVDTHTQRPLALDKLVMHDVAYTDIARVFLMLEVYPHVKGTGSSLFHDESSYHHSVKKSSRMSKKQTRGFASTGGLVQKDTLVIYKFLGVNEEVSNSNSELFETPGTTKEQEQEKKKEQEREQEQEESQDAYEQGEDAYEQGEDAYEQGEGAYEQDEDAYEQDEDFEPEES